MGSRTASPLHEPSSPGDVAARKRVCKACDRCRLKKSKCDGLTPCSRCKADNAICVFGERKKSHDKIYPKGYVEMLEHQQLQLVSGLQELYRRLQTGEGWVGPPLKDSSRGTPLTHDILDRLGALQQDGSTGAEEFHDDFNAMQSILLSRGASFMPRESSFESDFDQSPPLSEVSTAQYKAPQFVNPFANFAPPTPPMASPHPPFLKTSSPLKAEFNTTSNGFNGHIPWQTDETVDADMTDYSSYDVDALNLNHIQNLMDQQAQLQILQSAAIRAINPSLTLKQMSAQEASMQQFYQGGLYT